MAALQREEKTMIYKFKGCTYFDAINYYDDIVHTWICGDGAIAYLDAINVLQESPAKLAEECVEFWDLNKDSLEQRNCPFDVEALATRFARITLEDINEWYDGVIEGYDGEIEWYSERIE